MLTKEGKYYLIGQKLRAQRISKKSKTKEEDAKMARFKELSNSEL